MSILNLMFLEEINKKPVSCIDVPKRNKQKACKLQINIEAQNSIYNDYKIVTRGIAYTSRLISKQVKTVIDGDNYQKMQKTYSIWLMPQAPLKYDGTIKAPLKYDGTIRIYSLQEKVESGIPLKEKEAYDKIKIATIYTSSKHEISQKYEQNDELLRVVMLLFGMSGRSVQEIRGILEKEYGFKMSDKLKKGVENMCNLAQGLIIENRTAGRMEGKAEEKYEILINLLEQTDISLKKIMKIVGLVKKEEVKVI